MKLIYVTLMFVLFLNGCELSSETREDANPEVSAMKDSIEVQLSKFHEGDAKVVKIDGCDYIIYERAEGANRGFGFMAHKGNCSNPVHKHNREGVEPGNKSRP